MGCEGGMMGCETRLSYSTASFWVCFIVWVKDADRQQVGDLRSGCNCGCLTKWTGLYKLNL